MANGMMAMAPRTGGGLRMNRNINPKTGEPYANTIKELKEMQAGGEQLSPFQMRRLGNAGQGEQQPQQLNRLSPGVYRNAQGELVNSSNQPFSQSMIRAGQNPTPPQQTPMPQGMMQPPQTDGMMPFQPGQRPTFPATPGAPNFLSQLTPQQQFDIAKKQYMPQQQGQMTLPSAPMDTGYFVGRDGPMNFAPGIGANFGSLFNRR